ncbi:ANTAR domain-containing protein [Streptomyces sp. NBC_00878]|uniref:ANTAR domain-containing protein n=1 Tax=Streptomyces sp. NBC_00878 TaxID=2975854 RepID=UPI00225B27E8|nr:ANTAR domain-containing protein [Streptomyces sp. NBC_00878]MCX4908425.1 ANTAR domain-containing protein [Streptomyces sp. NBC_00878]
MRDSSREARLGAALVEAADTLSEAFDTVAYLRRLSDHCVTLLNASAAGIMLIEGGERVSFGVSSRQRELALDLLEVQHHGGPCLDSYGTGEPVPPVAIRAAHAALRWPDFTERALRYDIGGTFAVPLRRDGAQLGALNVFLPELARPAGRLGAADGSGSADGSEAADGSGSADGSEAADGSGSTDGAGPTSGLGSGSTDGSGLHLAQALADAAALGLTNHRLHTQYRTLTGQLQGALSSRVRIEQAKGMLAERWQTGVGDAFLALRQYARSRRLPLDEVATAVLAGSEDAAELGRGRPGRS